MSSSLVSIIIPVFNRENLIIDTLKSINAQSYENWECILVDDGSTDGTIKIIEEYISCKEKFKLFHRPKEKRKGANSCRNYGFEMSKGDYINWFDSDDIMHNDFIFLKSSSFNKNIDVVISKTSVFKGSVNNIIYKENRTKYTQNTLEDFLTLTVSWYLPDTMWKREFLNNKNLFDENLFKGQDRDFHTRRLIENPEIFFLDKYLTYYRRHNNTITGSTKSDVILSFFNSLNNRLLILDEIGISNKVKFTFLKLQISNYAYLHKEKNILNKYFQLIKKLFVFNKKNVTVIIKFIIAIIFFNIIGKGSIFLKN
jgi:glycosyltransferase involved in cell wall biosynthesis